MMRGRKESVKKDVKKHVKNCVKRFDQVFAGDKDAMEKRDKIFNGATETGQK